MPRTRSRRTCPCSTTSLQRSWATPAQTRSVERMKTNPDGYHTWTDDEVERFLERHGPGTKARLVAAGPEYRHVAARSLPRGLAAPVGERRQGPHRLSARENFCRCRSADAAGTGRRAGQAAERPACCSSPRTRARMGYKPELLATGFGIAARGEVPGFSARSEKGRGDATWPMLGRNRMGNGQSYLAHKDTKQAASTPSKQTAQNWQTASSRNLKMCPTFTRQVGQKEGKS